MHLVLAILLFAAYFIIKSFKDAEQKERAAKAAEKYKYSMRPCNQYLEDDYRMEYYNNWYYGDRSMFPEKYMKCFEDEKKIRGMWICAMAGKRMQDEGYNSTIYGYEDPFRRFNCHWNLVKYRYEKEGDSNDNNE